MQDDKEAQTRSMLRSEIGELEKNYRTLRDYVAGSEVYSLEVVGALQAFKDGLSRISALILTLYVLKGQKTKITWDPLLVNISNALENLTSTSHPNPRAAIQLSFTMSEPNAQEVMVYLSKLKETLR